MRYLASPRGQWRDKDGAGVHSYGKSDARLPYVKDDTHKARYVMEYSVYWDTAS